MYLAFDDFDLFDIRVRGLSLQKIASQNVDVCGMMSNNKTITKSNEASEDERNSKRYE